MKSTSPVYFLPPAVGLLHLTGSDRVAFLQRQTTNDVAALSPTRAVTTVLTSATARILDVLQLFEENETIHILPLPGHTETTFTYLRRRIFFNDNVTLSNASTSYLILNLEGENAGDWLRVQGVNPPSHEGTTTGILAGIPIRVLGQSGLAGVSYRMIAPAGAPLLEHLQTAHILPMPPEVYDILRIEAGLPAPGCELTEDYTPHETNLGAWISETKGCYTGQEILARQVTYDKITRHLVGLSLDAPVPPGSNVLVEAKSVGTITSAGLSPRLGPIALAVLKRPYHEPGISVAVETETGLISGTIRTLPFLSGSLGKFH